MLTEEERAELFAMAERDEWNPDSWNVIKSSEPVVVQFELYPAEVVELDRKAFQNGKTRSEYLRQLATASIA